MLISVRLVHAALTVVEHNITLEQDPALSPWAWYAEKHQHYRSIFFPLVELQQTPHLREGERINASLNYIFGESFGFTPWQRSRDILDLIHCRLKDLLGYSSSLTERAVDVLPDDHLSPPAPFAGNSSAGNLGDLSIWGEWGSSMKIAGPNPEGFSGSASYDGEY